MRWFAFAFAFAFALVAAAMGACGGGEGAGAAPPLDAGSSDGGSTDAAAGTEASVDASPRTIAITTHAPASGTTPGGIASAAWAAVEDGDAGWRALAPADAGVYAFATTEQEWTIALACDDTEVAASTVMVIARPSTTTSLDVTLDVDCALPAATAHAISGTLSHAPATTGWLDFGYALDVRGSVLPVSAESGDYEIVNVVDGTWDLFFGLRDDAFGPLTAVAIVRGKTLGGADATLDVDVASDGFAPGSKSATVRGFAGESFDPTILYVAQGDHGLPVGPGSTSDGANVGFVYATVPAGRGGPGDLYRFELTATGPDRAYTRALSGSFHTPVDLDATLPAALGAPTTTTVATTPYLRLTTELGGRGADATQEVAYEVALSPRSHRRWRVSVDPHLGIAPAMPDLSAAPGFAATWTLPMGSDVAVTATAREPPSVLSDGTIARVVTATHTFTP